MKLWMLAGLFSVATISMANASESAIDCGLDTPQLMSELTVANVEAAPVSRKGGRAPREEAANTAQPVAPAATPRQAPAPEQRRRGGSSRRVPDAMLIDGRGVL